MTAASALAAAEVDRDEIVARGVPDELPGRGDLPAARREGPGGQQPGDLLAPSRPCTLTLNSTTSPVRASMRDGESSTRAMVFGTTCTGIDA